MQALSTEAIEAGVQALHQDWSVVDGHHLKRHYTFPDFKTALAFVNCVGEVAEELGHHPDISFTWGRVDLEIHTHDIDGLSEKDLGLARRCDELS